MTLSRRLFLSTLMAGTALPALPALAAADPDVVIVGGGVAGLAATRTLMAANKSVLVVEAQARSGALVTARLARQMGRPLLAVPGSPGTDGLIAAGKARAVADVDQLLLALAGAPPPTRIVPDAFASLVSALGEGPAPAPVLARRLGLSLPAALALISEAELGGWIGRGAGGAFEAAQTEDTRGN